MLVACLGALALLLAACTQPALAASPADASFDTSPSPLVPYIINGQESSISQFPWQVFLFGVIPEGGEKVLELSCGGSILDATHVLTAAHCVDHEGTTATYPPGEFVVIAGASNVNSVRELTGYPPESQHAFLSSIRTDPYYAVTPAIKDDVAVLTLAAPLTLSAAANAQAIPLVPAGATPPEGTALSLSGFGKQEGAESAQPNGKLYSTLLTAIGSDACRRVVGVNSAVLLCADAASSSGCLGDSGGPLTEGTPAVEVGIVDFGPKECPPGQPAAFSNVAAPEIRAFIEGSESPPVAARPISSPVLKSIGAAPVDFSPLTCEPGEWNGSPSFTYTFQVENTSAQVLQSGPSNIFAPPSTLVGAPVVCIVQASNPGGVTTFRSGTTPPIAADTAPPSVKITALKCHLQVCTLAVTASDPNGVALSLASSAAYTVTTKCPKKRKKKKGKKPAKQPVCHRAQTVPMSAATLSPSSFQAGVSRLPYGEAITFIVDASNAAGLQAPPASTETTLHKPKPKKSKKKSKRRK